jgi:molecular chaperone GrpE
METNRKDDPVDKNEEPQNPATETNGAEHAGEANGEDKYKAEADQARQDLLYLRAEFENTKRRMLREQENSIRFANEKLIESLIPVIDLFERAIASAGALKAKGEADVNNFVIGIEMTHREFIQILSRFGVEFIGAVGEKFDPSRHEAITQQEVEQADKAETVLHVLQRGCLLQGRLLAPAKVVVAKASA